MDWDERVRWVADRYEGGSCRALGRRIGLSGQAVSAWVRGDSVPSGDALAAIAVAYPELRPRWLLTGRGRPAVPSGDGHPQRGDGRPAGARSPSVDGVVFRSSAYEAGRRDAVLEMMRMLEPHSPVTVRHGNRAGER